MLGYRELPTFSLYLTVIFNSSFMLFGFPKKLLLDNELFQTGYFNNYRFSSFIVFHHCLSSIILGSPILTNPLPESNFLISVSSLYLLVGVPTKLLIAL